MVNTANYTQVKVSVDAEIASAFKTACLASNVSMASVISDYMAKYAGKNVNKKPTSDLSTRRQRRQAVCTIIQRLEQVRNAEECYRDNIPENLQGSIVFERAENFISVMEEVLDLLGSIE